MYECTRCGNKSYSINHINNYFKYPVNCDDCGEEFCTKKQLKDHFIKNHRVPKIYNTIYIYKITCPKGKCYIGRTVDLEKRIRQHKTNNLSPLYEVFREFKKEVAVDIIEEIKMDSEDELFREASRKEVEFITRHDSVNNGYNTIYS